MWVMFTHWDLCMEKAQERKKNADCALRFYNNTGHCSSSVSDSTIQHAMDTGLIRTYYDNIPTVTLYGTVVTVGEINPVFPLCNA